MTINELLPRTKVTAYLLGGSLTIAGFWLSIEMGVLADWPDAWVMGAFAIIIGFIVAWIIPDRAWEKAQRHLRGTIQDPAGGEDTEVSGDVTVTPTGAGTAEIEGEVQVGESDEFRLDN